MKCLRHPKADVTSSGLRVVALSRASSPLRDATLNADSQLAPVIPSTMIGSRWISWCELPTVGPAAGPRGKEKDDQGGLLALGSWKCNEDHLYLFSQAAGSLHPHNTEGVNVAALYLYPITVHVDKRCGGPPESLPHRPLNQRGCQSAQKGRWQKRDGRVACLYNLKTWASAVNGVQPWHTAKAPPNRLRHRRLLPKKL